MPSAVVAWGAAALAIRQDALGVTAAALLTAAVAIVIGCVVFVAPRDDERPGPALDVLRLVFVPAATLALILLTTGGSLARVEAGPVDEVIRSGAPLTAILRVTGEPSSLGPGVFGGGDRFLVDADIAGGIVDSESFAASTPVVVLGSEAWARVGTGDLVRVLGTLEPADRVGEARGVFLPATEPDVRAAGGWLGSTDDLRAVFREVSERDDRDGGLLPGMALGDRIPLDAALEEDMRTTGLTHLTAVSGANCSYVLAFAFLGLRLLRCPRLAASIGALTALVFFVLLVRPEPSVLRAAVMGAIGVFAVLSGRGRVSLTLLLLSIIVLLAVDPWLSVSFAFMLSVSATLGLVTVGPLVARVLAGLLPRVLAQVLAIPLTAQVFCTPILVLLQPQLPVYSLLANVLAAPVVPAVTLLGMSAVLALLGTPILAVPLVAAAQWGTRWVAWVARSFADAPAASLPWPTGFPGALLAAVSSLAVLLVFAVWDGRAAERGQEPLGTLRRVVRAFTRGPQVARALGMAGTAVPVPVTLGLPSAQVRQSGQSAQPTSMASEDLHRGRIVTGADRTRRAAGGTAGGVVEAGGPPRDGSGGWRRRTGRRSPGVGAPTRARTPGRRLLVVAVVVIAVAALITGVLVRRTLPPPITPWLLAMCDVGQGDGIVVSTSPGHALVVDAGPDPRAMDRCLDALGVGVVDALVITHLHEDHYGGVGGVVDGREVRALYYSSGESALPSEVEDVVASADIEARLLSDASVLDLPPLDIDVLWPSAEAPSVDENNASAVLKVTVPGGDRPITLLLTGDLEEDAASGLLSAAPGPVDVLKVAHHGARNGGSAVIEAVDPALAVISVGEDNEYGHPHAGILDALTGAGVAIARTDDLGSFTVGVVGDRLEVRPFP